MKREEVKSIIPNITDEQLGQIMDLHGADIERQKQTIATLTTERDTARTQLGEANKKLEGYDPEWKTKAEQAENNAKAQVAANKELKISFTSTTTNLQTGAAVDFTISFTPNTFNTGDIRAYHVVIPKLGVDTIISAKDSTFNSTAYIGTEDLQITAADVELEAIEALKVTGVSISGNKAIISFNRDVTVEGTGENTVSVTGEAAGQVASVAENAGEKTATVTLNTGKVFGENDTITIRNNGTDYIADEYGYEIANGTVAK